MVQDYRPPTHSVHCFALSAQENRVGAYIESFPGSFYLL